MLEAWRERVEKDLGGVSFERALVTELAGGLRIDPLYDHARPRRVARIAGCALAALRVAREPTAPIAPDEMVWRVGAGASSDGVREWREGDVTHVAEGGDPVAHALDVHDAGASIPLELGVTIGRWLDAIRGGGGGPVAVAVGSELFVEVAKLRALRVLAERSAAALRSMHGGRTTRIRLLARTSLVGFSRIEPETNALRATLSAVAGMLGGADLVATAPYDVLCPAEGETHARALRLSSTTGLVAALESHLAETDDPLRGAYLVESLTAQMIDAAWAVVRELEAHGGAAVAEPRLRGRREAESEARRRAAATGRLPRVGASRLARVEAPMLGPVLPEFAHVVRDTSPFEALRDERVARPTTLVVVGEPKKTAARADYLREVLSTWGATTSQLSLRDVDACPDGALEGAIVLCAEDAAFPQLAPLVRALTARGRVMIAGKPGANEAALREAGALCFVHLGADLPLVARTFYGGAA